MKTTPTNHEKPFVIALGIAMAVFLGVFCVAFFTGTDFRSRAAKVTTCTMAKKTEKGLVCLPGSVLQGNLCCFLSVPTPKPICKTGIVDGLYVSTSCEIGYRYVTVTCLDGFSQKSGSANSCKALSEWAAYGNDICKKRSTCAYPTTKQIPTSQPLPPQPQTTIRKF